MRKRRAVAAHVDAIAREFAHTNAGVEKALSMFAEADQCIQNSIAAAGRGGFAAMAANLHMAQQQLRQLQTGLHTTRGALAQAAAPVTNAPKEIDSQQVVALLGPLTSRVDEVRGGLTQVLAQIPQVAQRVAVSANRNPAVGILTDAQQQFLAPAVARIAAVTQTIAAAIAEAETAQTGK